MRYWSAHSDAELAIVFLIGAEIVARIASPLAPTEREEPS